jgi:hypothetical protein
MPSKFASGKNAISQCDRCSFRFKLRDLRTLTIKTKQVNIKVCRDCWEQDQPQLQLGMYPVNDPQAVRDPRPDTSYPQSRALLLQVNIGAGVGVSIGVLGLAILPIGFTVFSSGGVSYSPTNTTQSSGGTSYAVAGTVRASDGTEYNPI